MKKEKYLLSGGPFDGWSWYLMKPQLDVPVDFVGELCTGPEWDDKQILHVFDKFDIRSGYHRYIFDESEYLYKYSHSIVNRPVELPA